MSYVVGVQKVPPAEMEGTAMRIAAVALTVTLLSGCATTLAPGASEIVLTRHPADVIHCSPLGSVQGGPPEFPGNDLRELRNQAVGAGADTVLITSPILTNSGSGGLAYRCKEPPAEEAMK
jgi:hypothetical protein